MHNYHLFHSPIFNRGPLADILGINVGPREIIPDDLKIEDLEHQVRVEVDRKIAKLFGVPALGLLFDYPFRFPGSKNPYSMIEIDKILQNAGLPIYPEDLVEDNLLLDTFAQIHYHFEQVTRPNGDIAYKFV